MSHVSTIDFEATVQGLKGMCAESDMFTWVEGQQTYRWYGTHVGDYPIPAGFTKADIGRCQHAIRVKGAAYEIGVVERYGKVHLLWDFWGSGGLPQIIGHNAERLKQDYTLARARRHARRQRRRHREVRNDREKYTEIRIAV